MTTPDQTPQWAIIELMGHIRYGGLVSKDNQFGTAMLRVDVPQKDGSFVSQLINPSSLYRVTMCEERIARLAAEQGDAKPLNSWEMRHLLPPPAPDQTENVRTLRNALSALNLRIHTGYDFNADPDGITPLVGNALREAREPEDEEIPL